MLCLKFNDISLTMMEEPGSVSKARTPAFIKSGIYPYSKVIHCGLGDGTANILDYFGSPF